MRYGIFSDVHANLEALDAVLGAYRQESIDIYLCVGDIVGYAANPCECVERVREIVSASVAGNHDWAAVDRLSTEYFNAHAIEAIRWTTEHLDGVSREYLASLPLIYTNNDLTMVHGTLRKPGDFDYMIDSQTAKDSFEHLAGNVCFVGHSHVPGVFIEDQDTIVYEQSATLRCVPGKRYIANVGSIGQPRDRNPMAAYAVFDTDKHEISIKRVAYDWSLARQKIVQAGLPSVLGERLLIGY